MTKQQQAKPVAEQWRVKAVAIDEPDVGEYGTIYEYQIINSHGVDIARCDDETEADRIVAALNAGAVNAELLVALKALSACFNDEGELSEQAQDQLSISLEKSDAAIAKAEGR